MQFAVSLIPAATGNGNQDRRVQSVFTHLNGEHPHLFLSGSVGIDAAVKNLQEELELYTWGESQIPGLLRLLEDNLSHTPSDLAPDISRYDQCTITAAIASCIAEYQQEDSLAYKKTEPELRAEQALLLYSADFSGIQKFIFTVATKGALASLRSRSFLLELLMEHYIDELLSACGMSRVNLLYSGGGHCYLLLPNTAATVDALKAWNTRFNDWLMAQFGIQLYIAHGWTACSANDLNNYPAQQAPYTAMFRRVSAAISRHKLRRYSADQLLRLNSESADDQGRECVVCGRSDRLGENGRCAWCNLFVDMSGKVLDCPVYLGSREKALSDFSLPAWEGEVSVSLVALDTVRARLKNGETFVRSYTKNRAFPELPDAIRLYVGDYSASRQLENLAASAKGISRMAVCRMDVDNLGHAFVSGYRRPGETDPVKRDVYLNISRISAFSRQMSLFFKSRINPILEQPEPDGHALSVAIVYSGGDDVFLVGAWNDVITAAQRIQENFREFCGGTLTISAGISLHDDHFPIRQAASHGADLEDQAKQVPGKNALALFEPNGQHTYSWQEFREKVVGEKQKLLDKFFHSQDQELGNNFLYQILELLQQAREDRINIARYAYLLARMEPKENYRKESYREFSAAMYRWILSEEDRRQLITAIHLYVYAERKAK